jgi:hypothetical protein
MRTVERSRLDSVKVTYRPAVGDFVETTLERVAIDSLVAAGPVRELPQ